MTLENDFENYMQRVLDEGHRSRPDASAPPADMWQQVLAKAKPNLSKEENMHTGTLASPIPGPLPRPMHPANQKKGVGHYLNLAVTIALVVTVAAAGWFATSQLNQSGDPDHRLALLGSTPVADTPMTCDVDPLTQERVLEIVKNPIPFIQNGPAGEPEYIPLAVPQSAALYESDYPLEPTKGNEIPSRELFTETEEFANAYLECLLVGTQGQVWNFYSPTSIQQTILADFPVFSAEEDVTARIAERLELPAIEGEFLWQDLPMLDDISSVSVNPDRDLAILNGSASMYFDQVLTFGVVLRDADGKAIVQTNGTGRNLIPNDPMITGPNDIFLKITLVKDRGGELWHVIPWPSLAEMGNFFD